jgi:hypothetical protein
LRRINIGIIYTWIIKAHIRGDNKSCGFIFIIFQLSVTTYIILAHCPTKALLSCMLIYLRDKYTGRHHLLMAV